MRAALLIALTLLGGCVGAPAPAPRPARPIAVPRPTYPVVGLERVMGQSAAGLTAAFGKPDADIVEGSARKLQFASRICVLDAYLYPPAGRGEPVVTHIDTRQRDGSAIDRASCVAALARRDGGR
jgi:hypothetical protein